MTFLGCGHFSADPNRCQICAEREADQAAAAQTQADREAFEERQRQLLATEVGPNPTSAAATPRASAAPAIGATEKMLGEQPTAGVYNLPDSLYYADPLKAYGTESLSATSHRHLVAPSTPAHFRWKIDHPDDGRTDAMIFGKALHAVALQTGDLAIFREAKTWRSQAGQAFLDAHDPDGDEAPVLAADVPAIMAMAKALREHPLARLGLTGGWAEQALFGQHPDLGVWLRCKLDYLTGAKDDRLILTDIKTTQCAHPAKFVKSAGDYAYDLQADACGWLAQRLRLAKHVTMLFAAVEVKPPYLVAVHEIKSADLRAARDVNQTAERIFARCLNTGQWPGYPNEINQLSLPPWTARAREEALYDADEGDPAA